MSQVFCKRLGGNLALIPQTEDEVAYYDKVVKEQARMSGRPKYGWLRGRAIEVGEEFDGQYNPPD